MCSASQEIRVTRFAQPSINPLACRICWAGLLAVFPPWNEGPNFGSYNIRWPNYWSFSFSISPSNEYSGLISFRMDWLNLLVVQATLKSLLQYHISKASILWPSAFFINSPLMKMKEENKKVGLKLNIQKTKFMASGPIIYGK